MSRPPDFRHGRYDTKAIQQCGKYVGRSVYWKLFSIENTLRMIIHSVLSVQAQPEWWEEYVDGTIQRQAERLEKQYKNASTGTKPGEHMIYFVGMRDLGEIFRSNRNHFDPLIADLDDWLLRIEAIRLPRNIVAHSNYPNIYDDKKVDRVYLESKVLLRQVSQRIQLHVPK